MKHELLEKNVFLLGLGIFVMLVFGSLTELIPSIFMDEHEAIEGVEPLGAVALEGRDVYIAEGCHVCHSQMIRALHTEVARYGEHSKAGESVYDHPFLWGSKRTGPDLARIGGRYSDEWHRIHLLDPRAVVPESNMPAFPWLAERTVDGEMTPKKMIALRKVGVPYSDEQIEGAAAAVEGATELDALIVYLQQLGLARSSKR